MKEPFFLYRLTHDATGVYYYAVAIDKVRASKKLRDNLQPAATYKAKPDRKAFYDKLVSLKVINPSARMKVNLTEWSITTIYGPSTFPVCHAILKEVLFAVSRPDYLIPQEKH